LNFCALAAPVALTVRDRRGIVFEEYPAGAKVAGGTWPGERGPGDVALDQARLRGASRRFYAEAIDLGNEPPLSVDGAGSLVDRRRLSVQWFSGTILTGLCGAALMGGAVFASLDGETNFATAPEQVETALRGAISGIGDRLSGLHKTDRLPTLSEPTVARQILRVPTSSHVRDRELVRVRNYARVAGNLTLTVSDLSANIPAYNPQKLLTDSVAGDDQTPAAAEAEPDAEVSFVTCDLAAPPKTAKLAPAVTPAVCDLNSLLPKVKSTTLLPLDDVLSRVRDIASSISTTTSLFANADGTPSLKLGYASENDQATYFGLEPRVVPENVTLMPKTTSAINGGGDWSERQVVVKKGETVGSILRELGADPDEIKSILDVIGPAALEGGIKEGQKLRVLMAPIALGHMQPLRVIIVADSGITTAVALSDLGQYVPVDTRNIDPEAADAGEEATEDDSSGVRLYQSLYETALRNNVPSSVIEDLVRIYSYDVDFERKVQPGDSFDVLYTEDENGEGHNEVRYASLTVGGETRKYYRFQTADDGAYDYYDEDGVSAKKFLVRKPIAIGIVTSGFGWRTHPMLHISEMHTGVDWGAPFGTPIFAAGNGEIEEIGLKGGYGKYVRIRHANGYETAYGHMTAFARGLDVGAHVRQGQVIGFVGSTGLSTGSHVHFEIIVNDRFVDPMRIKLPRGRVLDGDTLGSFEKDRVQLDAVLAHAAIAHIAQAH
jgi:murein DD-endopeptidase MepM/ murein hydrolase activator NlpD